MQNISAYIWNFIAKLGTQLLWLVTTMILARFLTPNDFGVIGVLSIVFLVANTLTESGLGGALVIQKNLQYEDCSTISTFNIVISLIIYIVIFLSANLIEAFFDINNLAYITRILSLVFVIGAIGIVPRTILFYRLQFKELCLISLASVFVSAVISIIMALYNCGVYALVVYQLVNSFISTLGCIIVSKYKVTFKFYLNSFKKLYGFGLFTTITGIVDTIYENIMAAIFGKYMSVTDAGYLTQAKKIEEASSQSLIMAVNSTAFPILAKKKDSIQEFKTEARTIQNTISLLLFPILLSICVYSKEIILLLFGKQWESSAQYLSILIIASIFMIIDTISRNFIKSLGEVKTLFKMTIIKRAIGITLMVLFGILSVDYILYAYVLSASLCMFINCFVYSKIIKERFWNNLKYFVKPLFIVLPIGILMELSYNIIQYLYLNIIFNVLFLIIYYFFILPNFGINVNLKLKDILKWRE